MGQTPPQVPEVPDPAASGDAGPSQVNLGSSPDHALLNAIMRSSVFSQLPVPTFPGSEHPMIFLQKLEDYFSSFPHLTFSDKMRILDQALKDDASLWFRPRRASYTTFHQFKRDFESEFWGTSVQSEVIGGLYSGRFKNGSMETYARRLHSDLAFLSYPIPEPVAVDILIKHFDPRIQHDLMLFEVSTFQALFAKLRILDKNIRFLRTEPEAGRRTVDTERGFLSKNGPSSFQHSSYSKNFSGPGDQRRSNWRTGEPMSTPISHSNRSVNPSPNQASTTDGREQRNAIPIHHLVVGEDNPSQASEESGAQRDQSANQPIPSNPSLVQILN
ncbi:Hypothetical protein NTJ_10836 [Nesidiocoris tenuis]|uniref:Retrotransposon gag domain-containing protein n=1 Tax=Nesidiocoris tenuis TaxID=355587 RepID=A0ABN7AHU8_9HEMI|nr:Hypothetical protein NTJ_04331 [Nesidiocoris tenuis]BES98021.1 Hypothetical protein NTJ_10836 [Nesidiocoris tenuis]